ncbi:hypothetical protein EYF80_038133 [Liparis tanakae]|uniref:Uncharacterized protein n=1 Tax=Liparis tanakae TaxID=230148 RepID=A0A4Z2GFJ5_9TELE|nr:hypothetical protein EYF80_038133 [Liparis tanakae]
MTGYQDAIEPVCLGKGPIPIIQIMAKSLYFARQVDSRDAARSRENCWIRKRLCSVNQNTDQSAPYWQLGAWLSRRTSRLLMYSVVGHVPALEQCYRQHDPDPPPPPHPPTPPPPGRTADVGCGLLLNSCVEIWPGSVRVLSLSWRDKAGEQKQRMTGQTGMYEQSPSGSPAGLIWDQTL